MRMLILGILNLNQICEHNVLYADIKHIYSNTN